MVDALTEARAGTVLRSSGRRGSRCPCRHFQGSMREYVDEDVREKAAEGVASGRPIVFHEEQAEQEHRGCG